MPKSTLPTDPRERYLALARRRLGASIKAIKGVAGIASKLNKFDTADIRAMERVLDDAISSTIAHLHAHIAGPTGNGQDELDLDAVRAYVIEEDKAANADNDYDDGEDNGNG